MKQARWIILLAALLCLLMCGSALAENQYYEVAAPVEINAAETVTLTLNAKIGWAWNITDNMDVTSWLITEDGKPAFADESGIAVGKLVMSAREDVEGEIAAALDVMIDVNKITGFAQNGGYDLYVKPTNKITLWAVGDNHGQYNDSTEYCGAVVIPAVSVEGKLTANANKPVEVTNGTVQIVLTLDGLDDAKIDSSEATISLLPGDGYKTYQVAFEPGTLSEAWLNGKADYTVGEISGTFSPQGGDGNGHYDFRIGIDGLKYNGMPLAQAVVRTDYYSFGRTFLTEGGSLILNSQPDWSASTEIPVLCDVYPDTFTAVWPVGFDASGLTNEDVKLTLISVYGDEMTLQAAQEYWVVSGITKTDITVSYIYWAYAPVYTTLRVEVASDSLAWNELMYKPGSAFIHDYDIASVFVYNVMGGGPSGTQAWTIFGLNNLTDSSQVYMDATYTLEAIDEEGNTFFYGEDENGNGIRVNSAAEAIAFNCNEECNVHLENDTLYYTRQSGVEEKTVGADTVVFTKNYVNCETLFRPVSELIDVELAPGYAIGQGWEDHIKWPWQSFVNVGFIGGSK